MEDRRLADHGRPETVAIGGARDVSPRAATHLRRPRLVTAALTTPVAWLIAPAGYGKTGLLAEAVASLGHAGVFVELPPAADPAAALLATLHQGLRREGLAGVAEALEPFATADDGGVGFVAELTRQLADRSEPLALVIDDIGRLRESDERVAALLGSFAAAIRRPHHLLLAGRPLLRASRPGSTVIGQTDLAFTPEEVVALATELGRPLEPGTATRLVTATGGWPAAIATALEADQLDALTLRRGMEPLVEAILAELPPSARQAAAVLANVPLLSGRVAAAAVPQFDADAVLASGLVGPARPDGWFAMAEPIRDVLRGRAPLSEAPARGVARQLLDDGEATGAIALLLGRGDLDGLADLLATQSWRALQAIGLAELRAVLGVLPAATVDRRPELLLALARVAESAVELTWRTSLLERAAAATERRGDAGLRRAVLAERASDAAIQGDVEAALALAAGALATGPGEAATDTRASEIDGAAATGPAPRDLVTRARALWAEGRALAFTREPAAMARAATRLREAAFLYAATDEPELRAQALATLGYGLHFAEGELDAAIAALREAAEVPSLGARQRAATLTFLADALLYAGALDAADAALREVGEIGRRLHDQRLLGYHAWMGAGVASRRGDHDAVLGWLAEAERHPGDWFDHPTGIEFLADAADHLGRLGDAAGSTQYLDRVAARCASDPRPGVDQIELGARALHEARFGDPAAAELRLTALLASEQLPRREAWRVELLRGFAALRAGDPEAAARHARRARQGAHARGHPELPSLHEPIASRALEAALPSPAGSGAATEPAGRPLAISVLGSFAVRAPGEALVPPPGRPELLVKLLAVGGPIATEAAIEVLWPEVDEDTGRARLRNVLSRLRSTCGELVIRDGSTIRLGPTVSVDATEFERAAREALAAPPAEAEGRLRGALARHAGELLPTDRYEDFAAAPRERIVGLQLALLDRLARIATAAGDVDEALSRYDEAIAAAPLDEHRYEAAARLALERGRRHRAQAYLGRLRTMLDDLDVAMPDELARLEVEAAGSSPR